MKEIEINIEEIQQLHNDLFNYVSIPDDFQDLTKHFADLAISSPETYEIIILIYQEIQTREKINKKKLSNILNKSVGVKTRTTNILKNNKIEISRLNDIITEMKNNESLFQKIKNNMSFKNAWKLLIILVTTAATLALLEKYVPGTYQSFKSLFSLIRG